MDNWWSLVPIVVGGLLATLGGFLSQWAADHRVARREDTVRTFEQRRTAYVEYYDRMRAVASKIEGAEHGRHSGWGGPSAWQQDLQGLMDYLHRVSIYGSLETAEAASDIMQVLVEWGDHVLSDAARQPKGGGAARNFADEYQQQAPRLLALIRTDLKVKP